MAEFPDTGSVDVAILFLAWQMSEPVNEQEMSDALLNQRLEWFKTAYDAVRSTYEGPASQRSSSTSPRS